MAQIQHPQKGFSSIYGQPQGAAQMNTTPEFLTVAETAERSALALYQESLSTLQLGRVGLLPCRPGHSHSGQRCSNVARQASCL